MMWADLLTELYRFAFYFTSSYFILLSATMRHWSSFTEVLYIPEEEYRLSLNTLSSTGVLLIHTILCLFISLSTVFIWWRGRTVRVLMVSYAASLIRRFLDDLHFPFYLRMIIGSVVLTSSISIVAIIEFYICTISSDFSLFDCWVPPRKSWRSV